LYLGFYTSLRNESFIFNPLTKVNEYPKNEKGWNASQQKNIFSKIQIYKIRKKLLNESYLILNIIEYKYLLFSIIILLLAFIFYKLNKSK
jgi:hypothetical protein